MDRISRTEVLLGSLVDNRLMSDDQAETYAMFELRTTSRKLNLPDLSDALPGRVEAMPVPSEHFVKKTPLSPPFPEGVEQVFFGMGCFWGAERVFWQVPGVYTTAVGYSGGGTPNPTYQEVCSGQTGHNEAVLVVFDPSLVSFDRLLLTFWESHDPTQGMRQGNDVGTQYRSGVYYQTIAQQQAAEASREVYQRGLSDAGFGQISTEIQLAGEFYYAEEYHQQYLAKNPGGYCGLGGTGVSCG
jgi:peptide-methionine (S)-S-oxide reductase